MKRGGAVPGAVFVMLLALAGAARADHASEMQARESFAAGRYDEALQTFAKLYAEINRILFLPDVKKRMADIAVEVAKMTPEELGTLTHNDAEKWGRLIKSAGLKAD